MPPSAPRIDQVIAREVLDSRGRPTVEAEVWLDSGHRGRAIVPSGASTGQAEALELRDGDAERYDGLGVLRAVGNVQQIAPALKGMLAEDQQGLDHRLCELDGTPNKSRLGANALLGVSLANAHAAAAASERPLYRHLNRLWTALPSTPDEGTLPPQSPRMPLPMTNMISGGLHAGGNLDFQDFLIIPLGAGSYAQGLEWIVRVARRLAGLLEKAGYESRLVADEGGFGPRLSGNREALEFIARAIRAADLEPGREVAIALDVASSHFFDGTHYHLAATGGFRLTSEQMVDELASLVDEFPIISIEDGLAEEDWQGWQLLTRRLGKRVRLVGDDLFATNRRRLAQGIELKTGNSVLVKVNQIGTLTETLETMRLAVSAGFTRVVSARSGETEDTTIADLAVGTAADMIKIGSIQRSERLAKYNQLLRIEQQMKRK